MREALSAFTSVLSGALAALLAIICVGTVAVLALPWLLRLGGWYLNWAAGL